MKNKTKFERFSKKFLVFAIMFFFLGTIITKSVEYSYSIDCQTLQQEIQSIQSSIDGLTMQKQELVSFERLASVTSQKGYTYKSDAVLANYSQQ